MKFTFCLVVVLLAMPALGVVTVSPIGDSITNGVGSSDMGGYRIVTKQAMGSSIDFVGRLSHGSFADNQDEGWGGYTIQRVRDEVISTIPQNGGFGQVLLLTVGSNDFIWNDHPTIDGAAARANAALVEMQSLLTTTYNLAPNSTVLVSSIPAIRDWFHADNTYTYPEVDMYNEGVETLVNNFASEGRKTRFVDTMGSLDLQADFSDGVHPDDSGYAKIGAAWSNALSTVVLPEPVSTIALAPLILVARRRRR